MIGERVFVRYIGIEDGFELWPLRREFRELEMPLLPEPDEEDAFAVLRHDALGVYDAMVNVVAERVG